MQRLCSKQKCHCYSIHFTLFQMCARAPCMLRCASELVGVSDSSWTNDSHAVKRVGHQWCHSSDATKTVSSRSARARQDRDSDILSQDGTVSRGFSHHCSACLSVTYDDFMSVQQQHPRNVASVHIRFTDHCNGPRRFVALQSCTWTESDLWWIWS